MATINEAIKRLRYMFTSEGADKVAADLGKVGAGQVAVTATSTKTEKAALDLETAFGKLERRFVSTIRQQQDFEKIQKQVNAAVQQHPELASRANAVIAQAATHYGQAGVAAKAFAAATSGVQGQLIALSAGAGPAGTFLAALGPWGVAAAVGLGATEKALSSMSSAAHAFAQRARELVDFAESTGLTITQLKALDIEGAKVGVSSERVAQGIEAMTAKLEEFRDAGGKGFDILYKYNQGLALQLASARTTAGAINVLTGAFEKLDTTQRNALGRALGFGRSPGDMIRVLSAVGAQGGIDNISAGAQVNEEMLERIKKLDADIELSSRRLRNSFVSMFAEDVLTGEKRFFDYLSDILERMKEIRDVTPPPPTSGWAGFLTGVNAIIPDIAMPGINRGGPFSHGNGGVPQGDGDGAGSKNAVRAALAGETLTATANLAIWEKRNGVLGSAMTLTEQYEQKVLQLSAAQDKDKFSTEVRMRVQQAFDLQQQRTIEMARERFGVATQDQIVTQRLADLQEMLGKKYGWTAQEIASAQALIRREARETYEQIVVRNSLLPQLTQLSFEAGRLDKQFDQFAVGSLNNMTTALADIVTRTNTASDAFRNLGQVVVHALSEMIIKMTIVKPLAAGLSSSLGGGGFFGGIGSAISGIFGGGGGAAAGSVAAAGPGAAAVIVAHSGGVLGADGFGSRYVHPAYFDDAKRFDSGGIAGLGPDEIPIIAHRNEEIVRADDPRHRSNGGGVSVSQPIMIVQNMTFNDVSPAMESNIRAALAVVKQQAISGAVTAVAAANKNNPRYLR